MVDGISGFARDDAFPVVAGEDGFPKFISGEELAHGFCFLNFLALIQRGLEWCPMLSIVVE